MTSFKNHIVEQATISKMQLRSHKTPLEKFHKNHLQDWGNTYDALLGRRK